MLTGKIGVTTARNATGSAAAAQARAWAEQLDALYVERPHNMGVDELMAQYDLAALVVGEKDGPRIHSDAGSFAYHPGMAVLRLQQLKRGASAAAEAWCDGAFADGVGPASGEKSAGCYAGTCC